MKLSFYSPAIMALLGLMLVNLSPLHAADAAKPKGIPGHGKLQAVDQAAQTVSLESKKGPRVFSVTAETKITDGAGQPATLASTVVGEDVGVYYTKDAAGKMTLISLRLGAKTGAKATSEKAATPITPPTTSAPAVNAPATPLPATTPATAAPEKATAAPTTAATPTETKAKKQTFSGKVASVDAAANTLVVHGKTFTVTADTKITGAANLGAIAAGAHVSGSYTKSADGATLTVSALKVGK